MEIISTEDSKVWPLHLRKARFPGDRLISSGSVTRIILVVIDYISYVSKNKVLSFLDFSKAYGKSFIILEKDQD